MPKPPKSKIALQTREDASLAPDEPWLAEATAIASTLIGLAAEALRARADLRVLADASPVAPPAETRLPSGSRSIISEDEFGAWSRVLMERRVDGRATGGRRCGS